MASGILGIDPELLRQMMAQFGATEDDRKAANKQALTAFGLQLMGTRKGQEFAGLGNAGLNALGYRQQLLGDIPKQRMGAVQSAVGLSKMAQELQAIKAKQELQKSLGGVFGAGPNLSAMGPGGPTPENAAAIAPPSEVQKYRQASALLAAQGDSEGAKRYSDIANSMEDQYSTTPQTVRGPDGAISLAQFGNRGGVKVAQGLSPAEKLHFGTNGAMTNIGFDPFSGKAMTPGIAAQMDPAQADASKRGWAQYNLSANADKRASAQVDDGKWTNDLERGIQINARTGQSRPITESGQPIGNKMETKAKQSAGKIMAIVSEAEKYLDSATGSYAGAAADQAARVFGSSTEGATSIAQLQALEGALMLNQPRMEGPQSDKDTAIYKQMAGRIGDPTVPTAQKKAALEVIKNLNKQYAGSDDSGFDAEYSRLPSGALFKAPDGTTRRKP